MDGTNWKLALLLQKVNGLYPRQIENQIVIKALLDKQFQTTTYPFFKIQLFFYLCFFCIPLSLYFCLGHEYRNKLVGFSILGGSAFTIYEFIQCHTEGWRDYFFDKWNYIDIFGLANFWIFCFNTFWTENDNLYEIDAWRVYSRVFLIFSMILKLNFFMRIYDKLGLLVNLLLTCVYDIVPFTSYLSVWLFCFYMLYVQAGVNGDERPESFDVPYNETNPHPLF